MALQSLSQMDTKVIECVLSPESASMTIKERCKLLNISKDSYYRVMKKPHVIAAINEGSLLIVRHNLLPLLNKTMEYAMESKSNHQDRKYLFQLLGVLKDNNSTTVNVGVNGDNTTISTNNPFDGLSKEQLEALAKKYSSDPEAVEKDVDVMGV